MFPPCDITRKVPIHRSKLLCPPCLDRSLPRSSAWPWSQEKLPAAPSAARVPCHQVGQVAWGGLGWPGVAQSGLMLPRWPIVWWPASVPSHTRRPLEEPVRPLVSSCPWPGSRGCKAVRWGRYPPLALYSHTHSRGHTALPEQCTASSYRLRLAHSLV